MEPFATAVLLLQMFLSAAFVLLPWAPAACLCLCLVPIAVEPLATAYSVVMCGPSAVSFLLAPVRHRHHRHPPRRHHHHLPFSAALSAQEAPQCPVFLCSAPSLQAQGYLRYVGEGGWCDRPCDHGEGSWG